MKNSNEIERQMKLLYEPDIRESFYTNHKATLRESMQDLIPNMRSIFSLENTISMGYSLFVDMKNN